MKLWQAHDRLTLMAMPNLRHRQPRLAYLPLAKKWKQPKHLPPE
jgi:hypothetical protein